MCVKGKRIKHRHTVRVTEIEQGHVPRAVSGHIQKMIDQICVWRDDSYTEARSHVLLGDQFHEVGLTSTRFSNDVNVPQALLFRDAYRRRAVPVRSLDLGRADNGATGLREIAIS